MHALAVLLFALLMNKLGLRVVQQAAEDLPRAKKVELVATAVRKALMAGLGGQGRSLRPILTSYAVVGELEGALATIKQVKESQLAADGEASFCAVNHCMTSAVHGM